MTPAATFTAAQIAERLDITAAAIRQRLRGIAPAGEQTQGGNPAAAWTVAQLPAALLAELDAEARQQRCKGISPAQRVEILLAMPCRRWRPEIPLDKICTAHIEEAIKLKKVLEPLLNRQHVLKPAELKAAGLASWRNAFGDDDTISPRYFDMLFNRTIERDNGRERWDELSIYLPEHVRPAAPADEVRHETATLDFKSLQQFISGCSSPLFPNKIERETIWSESLKKYSELVHAGVPEKAASLAVRDFLFVHAPFLAPTANALRMNWERRLGRWQPGQPETQEDRRKGTHLRANYPEDDLKMIRHFASEADDGNVDVVWRKHYSELSDYTRQRHQPSWKCPATFRKALKRIKVNALTLSRYSQKKLKEEIGFLKLDYSGGRAMDEWVFDDLTADVQVVYTDERGNQELLRPQIVAALDRVTRAVVCWSMSNDKGPTSRLVCASAKRGIADHGAPLQITLENGWVFGGAKNINGRENEQGQATVLGLSRYGCTVYHHEPGNSTSKADLENTFRQLQRRMKLLAGYTGKCEREASSDQFKRQQIAINAGRAKAAEHRYTFEEFRALIQNIVDDYNTTPQPYGRLQGQSPMQAFQSLKNPLATTILPKALSWLFDEQYRLIVKAGGIEITHYGKPLRVYGGELPQHIGEELWALVDQNDASMVSFMSLDHTKIFTVESARNPSFNESRIATGSGLVARERAKLRSHLSAINQESSRLYEEFGNTRQDALAQLRNQPSDGGPIEAERRLIIDPQMQEAGEQINEQREDIRQQRKELGRQQRQAETIAAETGLNFPADGIAGLTPAQLRKLKNRTAGQKQYE